MNLADLQRKYTEYYRELGYERNPISPAQFNAWVMGESDDRFIQTGVMDLPMLTEDEVRFVIHNTP